MLTQGNLPILPYHQEIVETVNENQTVVIVGETGSGKTTQIPQFLYSAEYGEKGKIGITQPRRMATIWVSRFVAKQVGCEVGEEVGYKVRFDDETCEGTVIKFMTDGILLREMQTDPELSDYEIIVVDEAHERSLNIDFMLGLLKDLLKRRDDLKVVISSATIDAEKFSRFFGEAPIINVSGRMYPVEVHYSPHNFVDSVQVIVDHIQMIHQSGEPGDILAFLTGAEEIKKVCRKTEELELEKLVVLPVYGEMSLEEQDRVLADYPGQRKAVIATNIAETSLTVEGVVFVLDSGLIKQTEYNSETGIGSLEVVKHSQAGCLQRAGRAGRTQPGVCYRLYTEDDYLCRPKFTKPEIQRSDLAGVVLQMKAIGIQDVENFEFVDQPDPETFRKAHQTLRVLGALNEKDELTDIGWEMADLPLDPKIGRMVIAANFFGCLDEVIIIASGLSSPKSVFSRLKDKEEEADRAHFRFKDPDSDFLTLLEVWRAYEASGYERDWCSQNFLNWRTLEEMRNIQHQLRQILWQKEIRIKENNSNGNAEAISKAVATGLVENLLRYQGRYAYKRVNDDSIVWKPIFIHPGSTVFGSMHDWVVCASIVTTSRTFARQAARIEANWLPEIAPQLCRVERGEPYYSFFGDKVERRVEIIFNGTKVHWWTEMIKGSEAVGAFAKFLATRSGHFPFQEHNLKVMEEIRKLAPRSKEKTKLISDQELEEFYISKLSDVSSMESLQEALDAGLDLRLKMEDYIPEIPKEVTEELPLEIRVGIKRYLVERPEGERFPIVKVPVDEIFGIPGNFLYLLENQLVKVQVISGSEVVLFEGTNLRELKMKAEAYNRPWRRYRR